MSGRKQHDNTRNCAAMGAEGRPLVRPGRFAPCLPRILCAALFGLGLWQATALTVQLLRGIEFPTPLDCLTALVQLLEGERLLDFTIYQHTLSSCLRWLSGFLLACTGGIFYAGLAFCCPLFRAASLPTVEVLQLVPGLAWVPVAILMFGLGQTATIAIITLTTFPIVAISALMGFSSTSPDLVCVGKMCGYGSWGLFRTVYLPSACPHLLSCLRIAVGSSWRVLIAAEMVVGSGEGLGYAIIQSRWTIDYVSAFVCIAVIALIGLGLERLLFRPWSAISSAAGGGAAT